MFNIKWGAISGGAAFVLAFLTSMLMGQTGFVVALLRAAVFGALFFGLGMGVWALINTFVPELLNPGASEDSAGNIFSGDMPQPQRVNITVGDASNVALPDTFDNYSNDDEPGNISDLISGKINPAAEAVKARDIDQNEANRYNEDIGGMFPPMDDSPAESEAGSFPVDFGNFASGAAEMDPGEMASFADAFSLPSGGREEAPPPERKISGNKPTEFQGDFAPKEIAVGIRTVLERDK